MLNSEVSGQRKRSRFLADGNRGDIRVTVVEESGEHLFAVECDLDRIDVVRTHWPFLRDRRIDAYENLTKRYLD